VAETRREAAKEFTERQKQTEAQQAWDEAIAQHGTEFEGKMATLTANSPEGLQLAVSGLENWSSVAVHLADHLDELQAIASEFRRNPYAAVAKLGKLEDRLVEKEKPAPVLPQPKAAAEKPLPPPPPKVGGRPTPVVDIDLAKADMSVFKREVASMLRR